MTKQILIFFLTIFTITTAHAADTTVAPRTINLQAVLVDEGGNVLYNTHEADMTFSILDGTGKKFYEEVQHVILVNGAMSVLVGNGKDPVTGAITGGIPYEALKPDAGTKLLRFKLNNQSVPQEDVALASVPYSFYSQYATNLTKPIGSAGIEDGSILLEDLSDTLKSWITDTVAGVSKADFIKHHTEENAHPATSISVSNTFINAGGSNVQEVLKNLDYALSIKTKQDGLFASDLTNTAGDLNTLITDEKNARILGDNNLTTALANHAAMDIATAHPNGNFPASRISGTISTSQIADGAVTNAKLANDAVTTDKIKDGTITVLDLNATDFAKWDKDNTDDLTTSTNFGGDLSGTYNNLQLGSGVVGTSEIADGSIATGDMASSKVSQWTNDSGYITSTVADGSNGYVKKTGDSMSGSLAMGGNRITGLSDPTSNQDATTKNYVDTQDSATLAAANSYTDTQITSLTNTYNSSLGNYLPLAGGTMSGVIEMSNNKITNMADPTSSQDAATKSYVDTEIANNMSTAAASAFAWGVVPKSAVANGANIPNVTGSNTSSVISVGSGTYTVNFSSAASDSNYAVSIQQVGNGISGSTNDYCFFTIASKSTGSFTIHSARLNGDGICSSAFDFIVFH